MLLVKLCRLKCLWGLLLICSPVLVLKLWNWVLVRAYVWTGSLLLLGFPVSLLVLLLLKNLLALCRQTKLLNWPVQVVIWVLKCLLRKRRLSLNRPVALMCSLGLLTLKSVAVVRGLLEQSLLSDGVCRVWLRPRARR